jgi:predicted TPR repeat methyltransferase
MTPTLHSSGDLLADRRYAWAEAALAEGDAVAAADLAEQVLEISPRYAPAWFLLGRAREALDDGTAAGEAARRGALSAYACALDIDPDDVLGARLRVARLGAGDAGGAIGPGYVRALFDAYAPRFERHLVEGLGYRGPALIRAALEAERRPLRFAGVLDLGCGTGLMARALSGCCESIAGVDLSPGMLAEARRGGLYARLAEGDLLAFLEREPAGTADLVVAADVLVYVADLAPVLAAAARALRPGGLLAMTLQSHPGDGVVLGEDARYAHGEATVRGAVAGAGLRLARLEAASTRRDRDADVPGWLAVAVRP